MSRQQMIAFLSKLGMDREVLDTAPDPAIAEFYRYAAGREAQRVPVFDEASQRRDYARVRRYIESAAAELQKNGFDPAETLRGFADAIKNGATAADLLPRGA